MPRIEILTKPSDVGGPVSSMGSILTLDGQEVNQVTDITLRFSVMELVRADVSVLATERFAFTENVDLHIYVSATPGYRLLVDTLPDGRKAYTCELVEP